MRWPVPTHSGIAVLAVSAVLLIPVPGHRVERSSNLDVELVRSAQCQYRGISATFEELSRAYALSVFENPTFVGWSAVPNPAHPEVEALVSCRFRVEGPTDQSDSPKRLLREQVVDELNVTWCLNNLASIAITPHDDYARDAVDVFQATIDGFVDRMVFITERATLRDGPGPQHPVVETVEPGTVLLRERSQDTWSLVRVPSTPVSGWLPSDQLLVVGR
jgi:hypothetical protein